MCIEFVMFMCNICSFLTHMVTHRVLVSRPYTCTLCWIHVIRSRTQVLFLLSWRPLTPSLRNSTLGWSLHTLGCMANLWPSLVPEGYDHVMEWSTFEYSRLWVVSWGRTWFLPLQQWGLYLVNCTWMGTTKLCTMHCHQMWSGSWLTVALK